MQICITYYSKFGNNMTIADYLTKKLRADKHRVLVYALNEIKPAEMPEAQIYLFSTPIKKGKLPRKFRKVLSKLELPSQDASIAMIATSYEDPDNALQELTKALEGHNLPHSAPGLVLQSESFKGGMKPGWEEKIDAFYDTIIPKEG